MYLFYFAVVMSDIVSTRVKFLIMLTVVCSFFGRYIKKASCFRLQLNEPVLLNKTAQHVT